MMREHLSRWSVMRRARCTVADGGGLHGVYRIGRAKRPAASAGDRPRRLGGGMGEGSAGAVSSPASTSRLGYITTFGIFPSLSSFPSVERRAWQLQCMH